MFNSHDGKISKTAAIGIISALLSLISVASPAVAAVKPAVSSGSNWTSPGYSAQSTYYNSAESTLNTGNVNKLQPAWSIGTMSSNWQANAPALYGGIAYFALTDGRFMAVAAKTGHTVWTHSVSCAAATAPTWAAGIVYFGGCGNLYALNASTGALIWQRPVSASGSPVISGGVLYVVSASDIYALNAATGATVWTYSNPKLTAVSGRLTCSAGLVYFVGEVPGTFGEAVAAALTAKTGKLAWQTPYALVSWNDYSSSPVTIVNGVAYVWAMQGSANGVLYAMSASDGALLWSVSSYWFAGPIAVAKGVVYAVYGGGLNAINAITGQLIWNVPDSTWNTLSGPSVADGVVYFPDGNNLVAAALASTGKMLWEEPSAAGNPTTSVTVADGELLFDNINEVLSFQLG